ncbi:MAG: hypothetical protein Fur0012_02360 [Elusimicrobiota bacterium]
MKNEKKYLLLFAAALIMSAGAAFAAKIYPSAGSTSASFLKIPAGAAPSAMAGAFTAMSGDLYGSYYNPASLAWLSGSAASLTHNNYFQDLGQIYAVYALPGSSMGLLKKSSFLSSGVWAFSANYFFTPKDLERRSGLYESDPLYPVSPVEGKFRAWDMALGAHYGLKISQKTSFGATLKFITQNIDSSGAYSFAADLGVMKKINLAGREFTAALTAQNLGPGIKFNSRRYDLPSSLKAGLSRRLPDGTIVDMDIWKYIDNYPYLVLGAQKPLGGKFFLRGGYKYRFNGNELGAWSGAAVGIGFNYKNFSFDYALNPYGDLGYAHKLGVSWFFSKGGSSAAENKGVVFRKSEINENENYLYPLLSKPIKISAYYSEYAVNGENQQSFIESISFKARSRGPAPQKAELRSGELREVSGYAKDKGKAIKAFFIECSGQAGPVKVKFKLPKEWFVQNPVPLIYEPGSKDKEEKTLLLSGEDAGGFYYETELIFNTVYVLSLK